MQIKSINPNFNSGPNIGGWSLDIGKDIMAGLRTLIGGEIIEYTKMLAESREQAYDRMIAQAEELGANGIVCFRYTRLHR